MSDKKQQPSTNLFGNPSGGQGNLFGGAASSGSSLFNAPKPAITPTTGLFGAPAPLSKPAESSGAPAQPLSFGAPTQSLSFGSAPKPASGGFPSASGGFPAASGVFAPTKTLFSAAPAQPETSSTTAKAEPVQASGLFGSSNKPAEAYTPSVANSGLFGSTGNTSAAAAAPSGIGSNIQPTGNVGFGMNNFGASNASQVQAPIQQNNSFMMSANNQQQQPVSNMMASKNQEPASSVSLAGMKKKNVTTSSANVMVAPQQVNMRQEPKESCLMPAMDGDKLKAVTPASDQIMAIIEELEQGSKDFGVQRISQERLALDNDLKPLAKAMSQIYDRPLHDGDQVRPSIFSLQHNQASDLNFDHYYFSEISRQAELIHLEFKEQAKLKPKLGSISDLVEFFGVAYLTRSVPEAIYKLTMQHANQTDVNQIHTETLQAKANGDNQGFGTGLIRLMAAGEFQVVSKAIQGHPDYSSQDVNCRKVVDEVECLARFLIRAESNTDSVLQSEAFVKEQRARRANMEHVAQLIKDSNRRTPFFLDQIVALFSCSGSINIQAIANGSYAGEAALNLLFYPDHLDQVGQAQAGDPIFVTKIRQALANVIASQNQNKMMAPKVSPLLAQLYKESPLTLLDKLLDSTEYGQSLMILVFHLSHLLLRLLFFPDNSKSFIVFTRLFTYQTQKLIENCAHLLKFADWLGYINAIEGKPEQRALILMQLISSELNLDNACDYEKAHGAINQVLKDDEDLAQNDMMEDDQQQSSSCHNNLTSRRVWLEKKHSRSFLLLKVQRAFCMRSFAKNYNNIIDKDSEDDYLSLKKAVSVLAEMDVRSGYPQLLGYELAQNLIHSDQNRINCGITKCVQIYNAMENNQKQKTQLSQICHEFKIVILVAELAIEVQTALQNTDKLCKLEALRKLSSLNPNLPAVYWKTIIGLVKPALPMYQADSQLLNSLSQQVCDAEIYFSDSDEETELRQFFSVLGTKCHLNATHKNNQNLDENNAPNIDDHHF